MARHENVSWKLPEGEAPGYDAATLAVLMDLRDELRAIRRILQCPRFQGIPGAIESIVGNTRRRRNHRKNGA